MRPALCLAVTALAVGLTGCSSDGPTVRPAAAVDPLQTAVTDAVPAPSASSPASPASPSSPSSSSSSSGAAAPEPAPASTATSRAAAPAAQAPGPGTAPQPERTTQAPAAPEAPDDPLVPEPGLESAPPPGRPTCRAAALTVTDADAVYTDDAVQELFTVRTTGPDCQLKGHPSVSLLDEAGRALPAKVARSGYDLSDKAPGVVTLSRATSVSFFVATSRDGACKQAATLVTTLPGSGAALRASTPMQVCDGAVGVTPVRRLVDDHELHE